MTWLWHRQVQMSYISIRLCVYMVFCILAVQCIYVLLCFLPSGTVVWCYSLFYQDLCVYIDVQSPSGNEQQYYHAYQCPLSEQCPLLKFDHLRYENLFIEAISEPDDYLFSLSVERVLSIRMMLHLLWSINAQGCQTASMYELRLHWNVQHSSHENKTFVIITRWLITWQSNVLQAISCLTRQKTKN